MQRLTVESLLSLILVGWPDAWCGRESGYRLGDGPGTFPGV